VRKVGGIDTYSAEEGRAMLKGMSPAGAAKFVAKRRSGGKAKDKKDLWSTAWELCAATRARHLDWRPEYRFAPPRLWRLDWTLPALKIAVEVDGGQWAPGGGRHGSDADRDKMNHAAAAGFRVFHFSPRQLTEDPWGCVKVVLIGLEGL
jgi:very-short-patch-repair endonuclease